jgi:hypothetical protein
MEYWNSYNLQASDPVLQYTVSFQDLVYMAGDITLICKVETLKTRNSPFYILG